MPRFSQALLAEHTEGLVALSGCRDGELARRLRAGDLAGARAVAERYATLFGRGDGPATSGFFIELSHHLLPDDDWLVGGGGGAGRGARTPGRRHQRRPLRPPRGSRAGRRPDRDPARPDARDARRPAPARWRVVPEVGRGAGRRSGRRWATAATAAWTAGISTAVELAASCSIDLGFEQYRFPGFPVPDGETPFSYLSELCWAGARKRYHPMTSAVVKRLAHELERHRASRPRRVLPHLLGPDALREGAGDPGPGPGQRDQLDRVVHARDQPGRADRPQPPVRAVHQSGPDDLPGRRHRLQLGAARGGHPVRLQALRARAHGDGLQPRHVPGALGGARGGLRARVPAAARGSRRQGARDVRLGHGPARPRGRRRVRRVLPTDGRGAAGRGRRGPGRRGARLRRRDGPAEHTDAARREGAALAPATEAGGPERTATVRLAPGGTARPQPPRPRGDAARLDARQPAPPSGDEARRRPAGTAPSVACRQTAGGSDGGQGATALSRTTPSVRGRDVGDVGGRSRVATVGSDRAADPTTRAARATPRPASPGCGPAAGPATRPIGTGSSRRRSSTAGGSTRRAASSSRRRATDRGPRDGQARAADRWDPPAPRRADQGAAAPSPRSHGSSPSRRPQARGGSTVGLSDWERWLEFCARIDGFPRHLSIHSGGMLVTAAPLIDIAPLERATMVDRVVVQFDKRDVETLKLIKLDLLGLGMLAAMDETLQLIEHDCAVCVDLDRLPEDVPEVFEMLQAADTVGVFQVESRAQMQTLPKSRPQSLDDLVVEVAIIRPGPIQGNAVHPFLRRKQGLEPVTYLHPSLEPVLKDSMGVILYQEQVMRIAIEVGWLHGGRIGRVPAGDGDVALEPRDGEAPPAVRRGLHAPAGDDRGDRRGAVPPGRRVRELRVRQVARGGVRPDRLRIVVPQAVLPGPVPGRADQRPADGLLPGRGPGQRHQAPRRGGPAGRHQRLVLQDDDRVGRPAGRAAAGRGGDRGPARGDPARRPASSRRPRPASAGRPRSPRAGASGWGSTWSRGSASSTRRCSTRSWHAGRTRAWSRWSSGPGCPRRSWSG